MLAVIGLEIRAWPNISQKIWLAGWTSPKHSAEGS